MGQDVDELAVFMNFADRAGERYNVVVRNSLLGKDVLRAVKAIEFYEVAVGLAFHLVVFLYEFKAIGGRRSKLRASAGMHLLIKVCWC
ncbi:hypothetical protein D3C84_958510 [compost metagenome]